MQPPHVKSMIVPLLAGSKCVCHKAHLISPLYLSDPIKVNQSHVTAMVQRLSKVQEWPPTISMGYWPSLFGQDGWILAELFFCALLDRDRVEVHKHAKKEQYQAILTEQAWSIKDLLYGFWAGVEMFQTVYLCLVTGRIFFTCLHQHPTWTIIF